MAPYIFDDQPTPPPENGSRYVFEDTPDMALSPEPIKPKGILQSAVDTFAGAGARMAQGVNAAAAGLSESFGLDQGAAAYKEGADYWGKKAEAAGSTGIPAKVYEGIGSAPQGIAEFVAGPVYAAAKGGLTGYKEGGVTGALEGAALEGVRRYGIGKIFQGLEKTALTPVNKTAAMAGTMGVQTAAEGGSPEDIAAATITGAALSLPMEGGQQSVVRRNMIKGGTQPEVAADLAGRVENVFPAEGRFQFEDQAAEKGTSETQTLDPAQKPAAVEPAVSKNLEAAPDIPQIRGIEQESSKIDAGRPSGSEPIQGPSQDSVIKRENPPSSLFLDAQDALAKEIADAHTKGELTPELVQDKIKGLAADRITDFQGATFHRPTLELAFNEHQNSGRDFSYGDVDLANLGGLNAHAGSNEGANAHFRAMSDIVKAEVLKDAPEARFFRHGGDEFSIVAPDTPRAVLDAALARAQESVSRYAVEQGLDSVPHPKHKAEDPHAPGIGIYYGTSDFIGKDSVHGIVTTADQHTARMKRQKGTDYVNRSQGETSGNQPPVAPGETGLPEQSLSGIRPEGTGSPSSEGIQESITPQVKPLEVTYHPDKRVELRFNETPDQKTINRLTTNRFEDQGDGSWIAKGDGKARREFVDKLQNEIAQNRANGPIDGKPSIEADTPNQGKVEQFTATGTKRGGQDIFDVKLNDSQRRTLETVRQEISDGEAGQRVGIYNENEPGSTQLSWGSSFPEYFKNKGFTKAAALKAIDNALNGEGVTAKQRIIIEDMHQAKRQQETNQILSERSKPAEVSAMNLDTGDTLKRNGEQFKVTEVSPDGVTLKDGVVLELNHEEAVNFDRGTLKDAEGKQKKQTDKQLDIEQTSSNATQQNTTFEQTPSNIPEVIANSGEKAPTPEKVTGDQAKLFPTPPEFGRKPQPAGRVTTDELPLAERSIQDREGVQAELIPAKTEPAKGFEQTRQEAAEAINKVIPENSPDIGLSVKPGVVRDDTVTLSPGHIDSEGSFKSADKNVEARWKAANGLDSGPSLLDRTRTFIHKILSETEHFPALDTSNRAGKRTADILRRFESSSVAAKAKTAEYLHSLTATFGPKKMDIFTRKVILDDLMSEAEKGRELPFGYTPETLQRDHAAVSSVVEAHPDIQAAVKRRTEVNRELVSELVDNDLLPAESVLKPEAIERYQKTGEYSPEDINTDYFRHQVLEHANARRWAGISTAGEVRNKTRGWQKGRQGSEKDINTNFLEAEFEVFSQSLKELATKKALDEVIRLNDLTPELKAQAKKEGVEDWKTLVPEGHTAWQPVKGSAFYKGQTMPEEIITRFISENPAFADVATKFREVTILGGKKKEVIIPEGLAKTLDSLRTNRDDTTLDTINQKMLGGWKVWTLLSPHRVIKYNMNNMSGDMDAAIAADPAIMKHFGTAWKNAWNRKAGRAMSKNEVDMLDRGVIDAGISINEIPDISKLPGFQHLTEAARNTKLLEALKSGDLSILAPPNVIAKYFDAVSGITQLREGLLREAAYIRAKELLEQGKKVYWASKPAEIDALPDISDKAAKLSRELLGDYGNLSAHGEKIRTRYIPFASWMEINAPRYYRIFKNAALQGESGSTAARMAGVGTKKAAGAVLGVAEKVFLTQILFASVTAFNHLVHPQEEERMSDQERKQLHIILGTNTDGKVMSARLQGAFSDALSWFGLEDYPDTFRKVQAGKMTAGELAKKMITATPNKIVNATSPFAKLAAEILSGKSFFPDAFKPMPIRDKAKHAARFLSLDAEYDALTGKPSRGYLDSLKKTIVYESDPGEQAYNTIRQQASKFMEKSGKEQGGREPDAKANALYYHKQAIRYGDREAAARYKAEYLKAGGTVEGIARSVEKAHPLGMIPENLKYKFRQSLTPAEKDTYKRADAWYRQVYGKGTQ